MPIKNITNLEQLDAALARVLPEIERLSLVYDTLGQYPQESIALLREEGFLAVALPVSCGGLGFGQETHFSAYFTLIARLSSACSSTAQIFSAHCNALLTINQLATEGQLEQYAPLIVQQGRLFCFVGSEPSDRFDANGNRVSFSSYATQTATGWEMHARKSFATGSAGAQWALIHCQDQQDDSPEGWLLVVVNLFADEVTVIDDWNNIGQRATASGKLHIDALPFQAQEIIGGAGAVPKTNRLGPLYQLTFGALLTGIARGALNFVSDYLKHQRRPTQGFATAAHEPFNQLRIADDSITVTALEALLDKAADRLDAHYRGQPVFSETVTLIYQVKVMASRASVEIPNQMFILLGASGTTKPLAADRFWRNGRTLSLHDNIDKQRSLIGQYVLGVSTPKAGIR